MKGGSKGNILWRYVLYVGQNHIFSVEVTLSRGLNKVRVKTETAWRDGVFLRGRRKEGSWSSHYLLGHFLL